MNNPDWPKPIHISAMDFDLAVDALFGEERVNHGSPTEVYDFILNSKEKFSTLKHSNKLKLYLPNSTCFLMAQFVWQSSISLAQYLLQNNDKLYLRDSNIIELGAGSGLPSLVCALFQDKNSIEITDFPEDSIIQNLKRNISENLLFPSQNLKVSGLQWGESSLLQKYDLVLMADCLWLPKEHHNLLKTMSEVVKEDKGRILCAYMNHDHNNSVAASFIKLLPDYHLEFMKSEEIEWRTCKCFLAHNQNKNKIHLLTFVNNTTDICRRLARLRSLTDGRYRLLEGGKN